MDSFNEIKCDNMFVNLKNKSVPEKHNNPIHFLQFIYLINIFVLKILFRVLLYILINSIVNILGVENK